MTHDDSKAILITGASSGIGRATTRLLAERGFRVFAGVRRQEDGDALRAEAGDRVMPVILDVTHAIGVEGAAAHVARALGGAGLDGLVNNAGIGLAAPMEYVPLEKVEALFRVNVFGAITVTQAFLPLLRRARGRIVNIGSVGTHVAIPFGGVLAGTKSALSAFNDSLRLELRPAGIHVCLVEPASIATPAVDKTLGAAEGVLDELPPEAAARYGAMLRTFASRAYAREKHGSPPEVVARTVLKALAARRPRTRYLVGKDARRLATIGALLPARVRDRVELAWLGLPTRFGDPDSALATRESS